MAGFQLATHGRFWVAAEEGHTDRVLPSFQFVRVNNWLADKDLLILIEDGGAGRERASNRNS